MKRLKAKLNYINQAKLKLTAMSALHVFDITRSFETTVKASVKTQAIRDQSITEVASSRQQDQIHSELRALSPLLTVISSWTWYGTHY